MTKFNRTAAQLSALITCTNFPGKGSSMELLVYHSEQYGRGSCVEVGGSLYTQEEVSTAILALCSLLTCQSPHRHSHR